jgi:hypothetical protein
LTVRSVWSARATAQRPWLPERQRQRLPADDGSGTVPRLIVVPDAWKQSAQLDGGREFTAAIEGGADHGGLCLGDDEHSRSMGAKTVGGESVALLLQCRSAVRRLRCPGPAPQWPGLPAREPGMTDPALPWIAGIIVAVILVVLLIRRRRK